MYLSGGTNLTMILVAAENIHTRISRVFEYAQNPTVLLRLIQKWLKAGVSEDGQWRRKVAQGDVIIVRYADDLVMGFQQRADAVRFRESQAREPWSSARESRHASASAGTAQPAA